MKKFSDRKQAGTLVCAYVLHSLQWMPTSHCLTNFYTHGNNLIPISVLKILVPIVHFFCLARTVKSRCFSTEVSDCELMYIGGE